MALTNLKTVLTKTATMTGVTLAIPADRIGLGFGPATALYPTDSLSQGRFLAPQNPEPEQLRSRHGQSAVQMRKQMRASLPAVVPPASSAGCVPPGSSAGRVSWSLTVGASRSVSATNPGRNRFPKAHACVVRSRIGCDCQSPDRQDDKQALPWETAPAATAKK
jgi:hypothetical protein